MTLKKKNGSALALVIILMAVLTILGAALLSVSLAETKHASWQDRKTQAHYIARSGVYVGIKMVDELVAIRKYPDLTKLNQELTAQVSNLGADETKVGSTGYFTLKFEVTALGKLKIESTGNTGGAQNTTDKVTLTMDVNLPPPNTTNPVGWVLGDNNLSHKANASEHSYIRSLINIEGNKNSIKAPQGGTDYPVFQATSIKFINSTINGFCLQEVNQIASVTFDAQMLYFESKIFLNNDYNASTNKNSIYLTVSDKVLQNWMLPNGSFIDISGDPAEKQGFASPTGYGEFIRDYIPSDFFTTNNLNGRYGVVYFGGDVYRGSNINKTGEHVKIQNRGWYFFKNGTNLQNIQANDLIPINPDDAVIKAINNIISFNGGTSNQMWDNK